MACCAPKRRRPGVEILRDNHDIPHIYGETRADVMFGSGWVAAEDRGLLLSSASARPTRRRSTSPAINPFGLLLERALASRRAPKRVDFVDDQKKVLDRKGPRRRTGDLQDLEDWVEGVNAYEKTLPPSAGLPHVPRSPTRSPASPSSARSSATAAATK